MIKQAGHHIRCIVRKQRHLPELLDPDVLINSLYPVCFDQFLLTLSRINAMLRDQQRASMKMLCHTSQNSGISGCHTVIQICFWHIHPQRPEHRQINRAKRPQKIGKINIRVIPVITLSCNFKKIRSHQKLVHGKILFMEQVKDYSPVRFAVQHHIQQFIPFFMRKMHFFP